MRRFLRRLELITTPMWLGGALMVLGLMYVIAMPFGLADTWEHFGYALIVASASGVFFRWRYQAVVIERADDWVLVRCERRRRAGQNPQATPEPGDV